MLATVCRTCNRTTLSGAAVLFDGKCVECSIQEIDRIYEECLVEIRRPIRLNPKPDFGKLCPVCQDPEPEGRVCAKCSEDGRYPFGF